MYYKILLFSGLLYLTNPLPVYAQSSWEEVEKQRHKEEKQRAKATRKAPKESKSSKSTEQKRPDYLEMRPKKRDRGDIPKASSKLSQEYARSAQTRKKSRKSSQGLTKAAKSMRK